MEVLFTPSNGRYSVHDDLIYTVRDLVKANDPGTYPDYRYIADVYNGADLVARLKAYPQPDTKVGVFNISNILRNYLTPVFNPTPNTFNAQTLTTGDWNVSGTVIFGEEYDFVQYLNVSGTTGLLFYGHYNGRKIGVVTNLEAEADFESVRPRTTFVYRNTDNCFIPYLNVSLSNTVSVTITLYNSVGGVIATKTASETIPVVASMGLINIGIAGVNAFMSPDFVTEGTAYYTVTLDSVGEPAQTITINVLCEDKHDVYTLHFMNRFGGFETMSFSKVSRQSVNIEKSEFGKLPYTLNAGVPEYYTSNKVYNETRSVFASQFTEKMTLNTDLLNDDHYVWLRDLVLSPMVFMEFESGSDVYFVPVNIIATDYEMKKSVNDKVSNLTLEVEFGDRFNAQFR